MTKEYCKLKMSKTKFRTFFRIQHITGVAKLLDSLI